LFVVGGGGEKFIIKNNHNNISLYENLRERTNGKSLCCFSISIVLWGEELGK
jgi:hypothetical protein